MRIYNISCDKISRDFSELLLGNTDLELLAKKSRGRPRKISIIHKRRNDNYVEPDITA